MVSIVLIRIDAGAKALRERQQGGRKLRAWSDLPDAAKQKWRDHASAVLAAAKAAEQEAARDTERRLMARARGIPAKLGIRPR